MKPRSSTHSNFAQRGSNSQQVMLSSQSQSLSHHQYKLAEEVVVVGRNVCCGTLSVHMNLSIRR